MNHAQHAAIVRNLREQVETLREQLEAVEKQAAWQHKALLEAISLLGRKAPGWEIQGYLDRIQREAKSENYIDPGSTQ